MRRNAAVTICALLAATSLSSGNQDTRGSTQQRQGPVGSLVSTKGGSLRPVRNNDIDGTVIINGITATDRTQYPWMVYIICAGFGACGGSILSTTRVLTAAHCVYANGVKTSLCTVQYGGLQSTSGSSASQSVSAANIVYHPSFDESTYANDLAILKLSTLTFSSIINKINLPSSGTNYQGSSVTILGWGYTESSSTSTDLIYATTSVQTDAVCAANWNCAGSTALYDSSNQLCYSGLGVNGICSGDSGGPVVVGSGTSAVQVAINSVVRAGTDIAGCAPTTTTTVKYSNLVSVLLNVIGLNSRRRQGPTATPNVTSLSQTAEGVREPRALACRIDTPSIGPKLTAYLTWINSI